MDHRFDGKWYNQHGSELDITVDRDHRIRGHFRSGVGFPEPGEQFEIVGYVAGDLVGFVVSFAKYDCLTSWAGHLGDDEGAPVLDAMWNMTVGLPPGSESELWRGVWTGADHFRRSHVAPEKSRRRPSHPVAPEEIPAA
jgi:hypothetical protein